MGVLETARKALAQIQSRRNGTAGEGAATPTNSYTTRETDPVRRCHPAQESGPKYAINAVNAESPAQESGQGYAVNAESPSAPTVPIAEAADSPLGGVAA
jgi:hypothetical protein